MECRVFFRFIKQNLKVKTLFGTIEKVVYNHLFIILTTYALLKFLNLEIEDTLLIFISLNYKKNLFKEKSLIPINR